MKYIFLCLSGYWRFRVLFILSTIFTFNSICCRPSLLPPTLASAFTPVSSTTLRPFGVPMG
eukprot:12898202-Prorocentrum_lima.AAC.1